MEIKDNNLDDLIGPHNWRTVRNLCIQFSIKRPMELSVLKYRTWFIWSVGMYVEYVIYHPVDSNAILILDGINGDTWSNFNFLEHRTSRLNQQPESNFLHSMHSKAVNPFTIYPVWLMSKLRSKWWIGAGGILRILEIQRSSLNSLFDWSKHPWKVLEWTEIYNPVQYLVQVSLRSHKNILEVSF